MSGVNIGRRNETILKREYYVFEKFSFWKENPNTLNFAIEIKCETDIVRLEHVQLVVSILEAYLEAYRRSK